MKVVALSLSFPTHLLAPQSDIRSSSYGLHNQKNAFHIQGYFGVKVTPLGSNLTLLEEQEEGEIQALMEDAKGWLDQWFKEIRPWNNKEIDNERTIWLRVYGVPAHAWNDNFFAKIVKPWGVYINFDDGTLKKTTMDVARLMIRTSCHHVVDEFCDVKVNGKIFHLRVLEDSYGPMRILIPHTNGHDGRDGGEPEEEEEEEEEEEDEWDRRVECISGCVGSKEGGVIKKDRLVVKTGFLLGQEEVCIGSQNSDHKEASIEFKVGAIRQRVRIQSYIKSTLDLDSDETLWKSESLHSERVQKLKRGQKLNKVQKLKEDQDVCKSSEAQRSSDPQRCSDAYKSSEAICYALISDLQGPQQRIDFANLSLTEVNIITELEYYNRTGKGSILVIRAKKSHASVLEQGSLKLVCLSKEVSDLV
ncbi:hypothetical protein TSUD_188420 [Trifolium subterraneum]|uniref:Uncharacterized protein n=1 Tax=Trifolium subterraneum TaxID=3900 RepID=A0A2Z6PDS3_TRISU|nr:hypothetical protein TSUD_188420 [Trifolium subterraneum]